MTVYRVEKNRNYTVMANYHLRDTSLSLKSIGLLSKILSLPDDWNLNVRGLTSICKESADVIRTALKELEDAGYLERRQLRSERGRMADMEYIFYEKPVEKPGCYTEPHTVSPCTGFPYTVNPDADIPYAVSPHTENPAQSNTNLNKDYKEINTNLLSIHPSIKDNDYAMDEYKKYREIITENIEYDRLTEKYDKKTVDGVVGIMLDTILNKSKNIRIKKSDYPVDVVRDRLLELNTFHVEYVLDCMNGVKNEIRNIRGYMLTSLYNALDTMDEYYMNKVNHDFCGSGSTRHADCQVDSPANIPPADYGVPSWHSDEDDCIEEYDDEDIDDYYDEYI